MIRLANSLEYTQIWGLWSTHLDTLLLSNVKRGWSKRTKVERVREKESKIRWQNTEAKSRDKCLVGKGNKTITEWRSRTRKRSMARKPSYLWAFCYFLFMFILNSNFFLLLLFNVVLIARRGILHLVVMIDDPTPYSPCLLILESPDSRQSVPSSLCPYLKTQTFLPALALSQVMIVQDLYWKILR